MIVPFLNLTPYFSSYTADAADAATSAIDAIRTALLAAGWDEPGAMYTLRSPARSDIIRWTVTVAKVSATQISLVIRDHAGRLVNNDTSTKQNVPLGAHCNVYCGERYVFHEVFDITTSLWGAAVLNRDPDPIAEPVPVYFASIGPRNNADTTSYAFLVYNNWIAASGAGGNGNSDLWSWRGAGGNTPDHFSAQGSMMFYPVEFCQPSSWFWGRLPNCLWLDASQWAGNTFDVPLDDTTVGTFRVVRSGTINNFVMAIRIS